jgi:hypothetical protein
MCNRDAQRTGNARVVRPCRALPFIFGLQANRDR